MRRRYPDKLSTIWEAFKRDHPEIQHKITEGRIPEVWQQFAGAGIMAVTSDIKFKNGVLTIHISLPVARQEVFMRREAFKECINKELGTEIIRDIIVK